MKILISKWLTPAGVVFSMLLSQPLFAMGPGFGPPSGASAWMQSGGGSFQINTQQWQDAEGYYLGIDVAGIAPEQIEVIPRGRWIEVRFQQQSSVSRDNPYGNQGFMSSSQFMQRRYAFPMDADLRNMRRENAPGRVTIGIPRMQMMR